MVVGVIGAGTMGSGIAQAFAQTDGFEVRLCDIKEEFAAGGKAKIEKGLSKLVAKEKMTQEDADKILGRIKTGLKDICSDCDLIVEAAFEDLKVKQDTFKELQGIVPKECIFTSNTSSLSITEIGKGLDRPLIGMHFFNPAARMKLIEVRKDTGTYQRSTGICGKQNPHPDDQRGDQRTRCGNGFGRGYRYRYAAWMQSSHGTASPWRLYRT